MSTRTGSPRAAGQAVPAAPAASVASAATAATSLANAVARRTAANSDFFHAEASRIARLCHGMAERFARGGRLLAAGASPAARSDARHVAVEFVHPVIVGKRALPALGLTADGGALDVQVDTLLEPDDMLMIFGPETDAAPLGEVSALARARGALSIGFGGTGSEWELSPPSPDPFVQQELVETLYHVLWELVHVFFEHRGLLEGRTVEAAHDAGASSFLYPFLREQEQDLEAVLEDVRRSVLMKAEEVGALREAMVGAADIEAAADAVRAALGRGGRILAFGNGGSATDAMDVVADFRSAPQGWPARRALDLTEDASILTAIANDVGTESIFARQVIAHGREGDVALAFSTSGDSRNIVRALQESRRRGIATLAFVGYEGGRIAAERLADHVVIAPSQHIPRIQEAHATAYHLLRERVEAAPAG